MTVFPTTCTWVRAMPSSYRFIAAPCVGAKCHCGDRCDASPERFFRETVASDSPCADPPLRARAGIRKSRAASAPAYADDVSP